MTKDQFEEKYATRSNVTVQFLHDHGRYAEPCECGEKICEGWQMKHLSLEEDTK